MSHGDENSFSEEIYSGYTIQIKAAPIGRRMAAFALDLSFVTLLLYGIGAVAFILFFGGLLVFGSIANNISAISESFGPVFGFIFIALIILLSLMLFIAPFHIYFIYMEYKKGTTYGKKLFGLRVISLKSERITLRQAFIREVFRFVDAYMFFPGLITILLNKRNMRFGDMASGTMVVYSLSEEEDNTSMYLDTNQYQQGLDLFSPKLFSENEIDRFLSFAYSHYLSNRTRFDEIDEEEWASKIRALLENKNIEIDNKSLCLFFAEHCHQHRKNLKEG